MQVCGCALWFLENLGVPKEAPTPRQETEFQRFKLENSYPVTSAEEVEKKLQRIREYQLRSLRDKYPTLTEEELTKLIK